MRKLIIFIFFNLFLISCATTNQRHGFMFEMSDYNLIQDGVSSKEKVFKIMGLPTFTIEDYGLESWIYYSEEVEDFLFFKPKTLSRKILIVEYDDDNIVKSIKNLSLADEDRSISFYKGYTGVESHKINPIFALFANVGRISPQ